MNFDIASIAAYGAMGVNVLGVVGVLYLLNREQNQEHPRKTILNAIYIFMGFAFAMTAGAFLIEKSRTSDTAEVSKSEEKYDQLVRQLEKIKKDSFYSMDEKGDAKAIEIDIDETPFELTKAFSETRFKDTPLILDEQEGKYRAVKNLGDKKIAYGVFTPTDLETKLKDFFADRTRPVDTIPSLTSGSMPEILYAAGFAYAPDKIKATTKVRLKAKTDEANRRLIEYLSTKDKDAEKKEDAVKMLIQPVMMDFLEIEDHDKLIDLLSSNDLRPAPWRYYEAAQVYHHRFYKNEQKVKSDIQSFERLSTLYLREFERKQWTASSHAKEYAYYTNTAKALGLTIDASTGLVAD